MPEQSASRHLNSLREAVREGGFRDAEETEDVARWALDEIERLREIERVFREAYLPPIPGEGEGLSLKGLAHLRTLIGVNGLES